VHGEALTYLAFETMNNGALHTAARTIATGKHLYRTWKQMVLKKSDWFKAHLL
jgi:hypothetical protein